MNSIADAGVREQALDLNRSFIVQAPAGSGKTELLIQRFLGLLGAVEQPEQILAMTFTRKAAGEMKSRILDALERARNDIHPETPHEQKTWNLARTALSQNDRQGWRLLENPSRLKIQTLDSFCAVLTKQMPILSQTGGSLAIEENAQELYRETAHRILDLIESASPAGQAVRTLHSHLDNLKSGFLKRVIQLLQKRDQWMTFFYDFKISENSRTYLEQTLAGLIETVLKDALKSFPSQAAEKLVPLAVFSGDNLSQENPHHEMACLRSLNKFPNPSIDQLNEWKALTKILLTGEGKWRKRIDRNIGFPPGKNGSREKEMKNELSEVLDDLSKEFELLEILQEVQNLPPPRFTDEEWTVLKATLNLLPEISGALRKVFAEQQKTDFAEISLSALKALGKEDDPTDLLLYLDTKFQHILIDEYQDTSFKQHELLTRLTTGWEREDGRSIFIVGDPMQSIYRFRDAEVGLFLRIQRNKIIGQIELTPLTLKSNFRSQKKVVDWVNACFSTVFPRFDDQDLGAVSYSESSAALDEDAVPGTVIHPIPNSGEKEIREKEEADRIAFLIQEIQQKAPENTIAVLVRARKHLYAIIRRFNECGIAIKAEEIDPLMARPAIQDLLALMQALLSPWDRISWLSILRAPWCGLSLKDLHRLGNSDGHSTLWQVLNDKDSISSLSHDGQVRLKRFIAVMTQNLGAFPYSNFRDLLEGCWIQLGGPASVDQTTMEDIGVFFDEVSNVIEAGDFFKLYQFQRVLESLYASPSVSTDNPVQVMTMHKAKGLEFDTVILPGLGKSSRSEEKRLVYWIPHQDDLLLAPIEESGGPNSRIYDFLARMDRKKDDFESLRLLYVAATRTKKQLHLFGHVNEKDENIYPEKSSLLAKLWPFLAEKWTDSLSKLLDETSAPTVSEEAKVPSHSLLRLPDNFKFPEPRPNIEVAIGPETEFDSDLHPEYVWAGNQARCLGNVLHWCFMDLANGEPHRWSSPPLSRLESRLKIALLEEGLPPTQIVDTVRTGIRAIQNILEDEIGRWILMNHEDGYSEYPLTGVIDNRYVNKILDRSFIDEQGVRWIIDYKTGEHQGADLEYYFKEEIKRYKPQLDQYEELIKRKGESRPIKKALYYPLHKRLVEIV